MDVYYPLRSGAERAPLSVDEVDLALAQDLVDRFVRAGAVKVYVGPSTGLTGPAGVVEAIPRTTTTSTRGCPADRASAAPG